MDRKSKAMGNSGTVFNAMYGCHCAQCVSDCFGDDVSAASCAQVFITIYIFTSLSLYIYIYIITQITLYLVFYICMIRSVQHSLCIMIIEP